MASNAIQPCRRGKRRLHLPRWPHRNAPTHLLPLSYNQWTIIEPFYCQRPPQSAAISSSWHRFDKEEFRNSTLREEVSYCDINVLNKELSYWSNISLKIILLYRPGDWGGTCEDTWCFLLKSVIREAMLAAEMAMIGGHSDLLLAHDSTVNNTNT